jgi:hypothetical protein
MVKPTPNPPNQKPIAPTIALPVSTSNPPSSKAPPPTTPAQCSSSQPTHACESLASASVMPSDFATFLDGPQRSMLLGIQQVIMLADLAVNRALDNVAPLD